jgi:hypothetical protein
LQPDASRLSRCRGRHSFTSEAHSRASTEELLLELRRRIIQPRRRRHEDWDDWDDGLASQGYWPDES